LSLAWKLHWLAADQRTQQASAMKDLYDAVLLAELDGMHLRPRLQRLALGAEFTAMRSPSTLELSPAVTPQPLSGSLAAARPLQRLLDPAEIQRWTICDIPPGTGDPGPWLARLADAVARLL
jgi:hypothetical protein